MAGGCLVHCQAGVSRSATVVISYLMYAKKAPLRSAFAHLRKIRPVVCPNPGFVKQLQEYEKEMNASAAVNQAASSVPSSPLPGTIPAAGFEEKETGNN